MVKKVNITEEDKKIAVGFPLEREQVYSNIAVGDFREPLRPVSMIELCIRNPMREQRPSAYSKIKEMKQDYTILKKPDIMERFTIGTYFDYSESIEFVRYWSEERYFWPDFDKSGIRLRPLMTKSS